MATRPQAVAPLGLGERRTAPLWAWVELARVSNLPTCVSNVLVGAAIGASGSAALSAGTLGRVGLGIALLYVAGMALNAAADVEVDRRERPGRPIPSGRIGLRAAYIFTVTCFAIGLVVLGSLGRPALVLSVLLVALIVAYDLLHQRFGAAAILMGMCRGLVYLVGAAAVAWPFDARLAGWLACALAAYTMALTVVAREEADSERRSRPWVALALPALVPLAALGVPAASPGWAIGTGLAATAWLGRTAHLALRRPPRTVPAVLSGLAGLCLIDAFFLALLGRPGLALFAMACFAATAWGHRSVSGT